MNCIVKFIVIGIALNGLLAILAMVPLYLIKELTTPYARGFDPADYSISLSIKQNTVSSNLATWGTAFLAAIVIVIVEVVLTIFRVRKIECERKIASEAASEKIIRSASPSLGGSPMPKPTPKQMWFDTLFVIWLLLVLLLVGDGINGTVTNFGKMYVARPRPSFLNFCRPDYTVLNKTQCTPCGNHISPGPVWPLCPTCPFIDGDTAVNKVCHPLNKEKAPDMWLSFPSGHASYSMYATVYLAVYLYSRMRESCFISSYLVALHPLVIFVTLLSGIISSLSRVSDHRHHITDVISGALLGSTIGLLVSITLALPLLQRFSTPRQFYCGPQANNRACRSENDCKSEFGVTSPMSEQSAV